jgi:hypothetical protein
VAIGLATVGVERRASVRSAPTTTRWATKATIRPGSEVTIVNLAPRGLLVRTHRRVLPGKRVEVLLTGDGTRHLAPGTVLRCAIVSLTPLSYEAAIVLDQSLDATAAPGA